MHDAKPSRASSFGGWLNALPDWQFTATLYLLRWAVILPLAIILSPFSSPTDEFEAHGSPLSYLIPFLVAAPVIETLIECSVPYLVMHGVLRLPRRSPWPFVLVSAVLMVVLHPITPNVVVFAFVTGGFLAYVYAHFAAQSQLKAILHTAVYHAAINLVGWTMMFMAATT
jgi:hypothetical protein